MTLLSPAPATVSVTWVPVTESLWVASLDDNFVGTIECVEKRYVAVDGFGATIGVDRSLDAARARVAAYLEAPPAASGGRRTAVRRLIGWARERESTAG